MVTKAVQERASTFQGLNDRDLPAQISQSECSDLLNVELGDGVFARRNGYSRVNTVPFYDTAVRLDGLNQYFRINNDSAYQPSGNDRFFFSLDIVCRSQFEYDSGNVSSGDRILFCKGTGVSTSLELRVMYDVSINSNTGGWRVQAWDTGGTPGLREWTVNDSFETLTGEYRHLEFGWFDDGYALRVYDKDGATIGSFDSGADITTWNATTDPIFIGVDQASSDTPETVAYPPTNSTGRYLAATLGELRVAVFDSTSYTSGCPISQEIASGGVTNPPRELNPRLGEEGSFLKGYWKFTNGRGNVATDTGSEENDAEMASAGPTWTVDSEQAIGPSALQFFGEQGHVHWTWDQQDVDDIFNPATTGPFANPTPFGWGISLIYVPLSRDGSTIQDGTLFWTGTNATNPDPVGLRIVSGVLTAYFYEGGTTLRTISGAGALNLFTERGKRIRIQLRMSFNSGTSSYVFRMVVFVEGTTTGYVGTPVGTAVSGLYSGPSPEWSIGRHITNYSYPFSFTASSAIYGVVDDFRVVRNGTNTFAYSGNNLFAPVTSLQIGQGAQAPVLSGLLRFDEGEGNSLEQEGQSSSTAYLYPEASDGVDWDHGLVEPYLPAEIRGGIDFRRFTKDIEGAPERSVLINAGAGLYRVDMTSGAMEPVGGGILKGGLSSFSTYNNELVISSRNARRPVLWNGTNTFKLGMEAGVAKMAGETTNTSGSLTSGNYFLYYTYVDSQGRESNPGPGFQITIGGANNGRITGFQLPVARDPQVTARRVYLSGVNALEGGAAFRIHEQQDNVTVAVTGLTVDSVPSSSPLEFFDNGPAPAGGVVKIFNDRAFVGGSSQYPTRVYFSEATSITQFDAVDNYVNLDSDSGDPVVAMQPRNNVLAVYTRDRRADLWSTGLSANPIDWSWANSSLGCVSPQCVAETGRGHIFLGERSVILTDGYNDRSLSSPNRKPPGEPTSSIQKFMREQLNTDRMEYSSMALHRTRDAVWIALPSEDSLDPTSLLNGRNDTVIVFDTSRMTWTKHDYKAEILLEVEDEADQSWIYGGIQGYLCRLDDPAQENTDGVSSAQAGAASTGSSDGTSLTDTGGFTGDLKGYTLWFYDVSANTIVSRVICYNTENTVYFYDALPVTPATGDLWGVGMYPWYGDFVFGNQRQLVKKRPKWLVLSVRSSTDANYIQAVISPDMLSAVPDWTVRTTYARQLNKQVGSASTYLRLPLPYFATAWKIRLSSTLLTEALVAVASRPADVVPGNYKTEILEIGVEYDMTGAR